MIENTGWVIEDNSVEFSLSSSLSSMMKIKSFHFVFRSIEAYRQNNQGFVFQSIEAYRQNNQGTRNLIWRCNADQEIVIAGFDR